MSSATLSVRAVDLEQWPRKQHFELFQHFSQPYFNVCVQLNAKILYETCKKADIAFFHGYVYCLLTACHQYEPMMLRIIEQKPCYINSMRASVVELAEDESFRFSYFKLQPTLNEFANAAKLVSDDTKLKPLFSDAFKATEGQADLIHVSVLPWLNFSSFSHAFSQGASNGIPKFVLGQYNFETGSMPLAVDVHHALLDGLHVAKFIQLLQQMFDNIEPDQLVNQL